MSDVGHRSREKSTSSRAKRGRPRKSQELVQQEKEQEIEQREQKTQELLDEAVRLFKIPYDDRDERSLDAPSISYVAQKMNTSRMRVRKLLITADFFSSEMSRKIIEMHEKGADIHEISKKTGLGRSAVHSYLPFQRVVYKMDDPSLNAKQCKQFQNRKRACEKLKSHLTDCDCCEYLWGAIIAFEQYNFIKECGTKFQYSVDCDQVCFGAFTLCRKEIEAAFRKVREVQLESGCVCDSDKLSCKGSEELYTIFLRIGACCKSIQKF